MNTKGTRSLCVVMLLVVGVVGIGIGGSFEEEVGTNDPMGDVIELCT